LKLTSVLSLDCCSEFAETTEQHVGHIYNDHGYFSGSALAKQKQRDKSTTTIAIKKTDGGNRF